MKTLKLLVLATALVASSACKKKEEAPVAPTAGSATTTGSGSAVVDTGSGSAVVDTGSGSAAVDTGSAAAAGSGSAAVDPAADTADWVKVYAEHVEKKPEDPAEIVFDKVKVTKATFEPGKIEGGSASFEIDLLSLKSNSPKRDQHLTTADYLDTAKFATAKVDVTNVVKKTDTTFTADAKVSLRDNEKTYPVTFEVVEQKDDWVRIRGEQKIQRADFKVGGNPDKSVAPELTVKVQLTLKKS